MSDKRESNANGISDLSAIRKGHFVILKKLNDKSVCKLVRIEEDASVYLTRQRYNVNATIGCPFGSIFELDPKEKCLKVTDLSDEHLKELLKLRSTEAIGVEDDTRDNRFIVDDGKSQKLGKHEIETLKDEGFTGKEIIDTLIENSSSFRNKTAFSQEKYLKKKHQKYSNFVRVYKPNPALLTEMYYSQNPMKINNLRIDTISQMLCLCNVRSGSKYMVVDSAMGLLTAAVVDRLVGDGSSVLQGYDAGVCIQIIAEEGPVTTWRQSVDALNLTSEVLQSCLCSLQINKVCKSSADVEEKLICDEDIKKQSFVDVHSNETDDIQEMKKRKLDEKAIRKAKRVIEEEKAKRNLREKNMDGLLIITRQYDPKTILNLLIDYLAPSRPLVVYSLSIEPLVECYQSLKEKAVYAKISETWLRRFQVLPGRTRPDMNMSSNGGYLLTAIKVKS